jgi:hypothetical protein
MGRGPCGGSLRREVKQIAPEIHDAPLGQLYGPSVIASALGTVEMVSFLDAVPPFGVLKVFVRIL